MPFSRLSLSRSPYHMGVTQLNSWVLPHPPVFVEQMDMRAVCSGMSCPFQRILKKVTGRAVVEGDGRIGSNIARSWRENHPWVLGGKREADFYFGFFFALKQLQIQIMFPVLPGKLFLIFQIWLRTLWCGPSLLYVKLRHHYYVGRDDVSICVPQGKEEQWARGLGFPGTGLTPIQGSLCISYTVSYLILMSVLKGGYYLSCLRDSVALWLRFQTLESEVSGF